MRARSAYPSLGILDMAFYATKIPPAAAFGFQGGPVFSTNIKNLANGREKRNADWLQCRHQYSCPFQNITNDNYLLIKAVHLAMRGKLHTFLFTDPADNQASNDRFGTGDGTTTVFQLSKIADAGGGATYTRIITKPNTLIGVTIRVNGVVTAASVDGTTGLITFSSAPANASILTWTGSFDVQVRFDNDNLPFSINDKSGSTFVQNGSVDLIETNEVD